MRKRSKYEPTDSSFYLEIHINKCMMRHNSHAYPVRTQETNIQKMDIYEMNTQNILDLYVCSSDELKSKRINTDKTLLHVCYTEEIKPKKCYLQCMFF